MELSGTVAVTDRQDLDAGGIWFDARLEDLSTHNSDLQGNRSVGSSRRQLLVKFEYRPALLERQREE